METIRNAVIRTLKEYGGWWDAKWLALWLDTTIGKIKKVYDQLEKENLIDRKKHT